MNVLVKFPTRSRPHKFLQVLNLLNEKATNRANINYLVSADHDDPTMTPEIQRQAHDICKPWIAPGTSHNKIHACNRDVDTWERNWDIVILTSDDMIPQVEGWDDIIRQDMKTNFPDMDGALWYSDGYQDRICTMSIMGKKYYDRFGYIYHPDYTSLWSDEEWTNVAQNLGKLYKSDTCLFKHEHPMNTQTVQMDALYKRNEPYYHIDKQVYDRRKAEGFPS